MRTILIIAFTLLLGLRPAFADEHHPAEEHEHHHDEHELEGRAHDEEEGEEHLEILDQNVRLVFRVEPLDDDDREVFLVTATPHFAHETEYSGQNMEIEFAVAGHLRILEENQILLVFEAHLLYEGNDDRALFHVESSVVIEAGATIEVASMGDRTLVVQAGFGE